MIGQSLLFELSPLHCNMIKQMATKLISHINCSNKASQTLKIISHLLFVEDIVGPMKNIGIRAGGRTGSLSTLISILYNYTLLHDFSKLLPIDGKRNKYQSWLYNEGANVLQLHQLGLSPSW